MVGNSDINPKNLSNNELLYHLQKFGNEIYFTELYNRFFHLIFGFCLKQLANRTAAEDATSRCFEAMFNSIRDSRISNLAGWILGMARNICLTIHREKKKVKPIDTLTEDNLFSEPEVEYIIEQESASIRNEIIQREIYKLKPIQQQCIILFYYEKKNYQEIQDELGINFAAVKSNLQNGKRLLRDTLKRYNLHKTSLNTNNELEND